MHLPELRDGELSLALSAFEPHPFHKVPTYSFRMLDAVTGSEMGHINLRVGSTAHVERYAGHIGYGVHPSFRGHHYSGRSVRLLLPLARELQLNPLWITCDPDNLASRRTLEWVGAEFVEVVDVPADCAIHQRGHKQKCRYRIFLT